MGEIKPAEIKKARIEKGLSQAAMAELLGVSQKAYSMYEDGSRKPKIEKVNKIIEVLFPERVRTNVPRITLEDQSDSDLIAELKAHRMTLQQQVAFLQRLTETSLVTILEAVLGTNEASRVNRAYLETLLEWEAKKVAGFDPLSGEVKDEEIENIVLDRLNRLNVANANENEKRGKLVPSGKR